VLFLLKNGADPNISSSFEGQTALLAAARNVTAKVVDLLLEYGADYSLVDHPSKFSRDGIRDIKRECRHRS
jgi:ankyrin repeat protein